MEGGHTVPIEKIVSRYARSNAQLARLVAICDRAYIYDNSIEDEEARLIVRFADGVSRKSYAEPPLWVKRALGAAL